MKVRLLTSLSSLFFFISLMGYSSNDIIEYCGGYGYAENDFYYPILDQRILEDESLWGFLTQLANFA